MALCIADSLIEKHEFDAEDIMNRFLRWWKKGYNSTTGYCFDIGVGTRGSLSKFENDNDPYAGGDDPKKVGNGSIMRLAPIVMYFHSDIEDAQKYAALQAKLTHSGEAVDAAVAFASMLFNAIHGKDIFDWDKSVLKTDSVRDLVESKGSWNWKKKKRDDIKSSGYVMDTLEAAIWCVHQTDNFKDAVLLAVNLGDDADTVGAVTGQLAGAIYGISGIPSNWKKTIAWNTHLHKISTKLYSHK